MSTRAQTATRAGKRDIAARSLLAMGGSTSTEPAAAGLRKRDGEAAALPAPVPVPAAKRMKPTKVGQRGLGASYVEGYYSVLVRPMCARAVRAGLADCYWTFQ